MSHRLAAEEYMAAHPEVDWDLNEVTFSVKGGRPEHGQPIEFVPAGHIERAYLEGIRQILADPANAHLLEDDDETTEAGDDPERVGSGHGDVLDEPR